MAVFELRGKAEREVECDLMVISINFRSKGKNASDCSKKVMDECERFLESVEKIGISANSIRLTNDDVEEPRYSDDGELMAERSIEIKNAFDMKFINVIRELLEDGKYEYEIDTEFVVSDEESIHLELSKDALAKSKNEAEQLASALGLQVKGVKYMEEPNWGNDFMCCECERGAGYGSAPSRHKKSDLLLANTKKISVDMKIQWKIE